MITLERGFRSKTLRLFPLGLVAAIFLTLSCDGGGDGGAVTDQISCSGGARPGDEGRSAQAFASTLSGTPARRGPTWTNSVTPDSILEALGLAVHASQ